MTGVRVHTEMDSTDVLVGTLFAHRRRGTETASFVYDPGYLSLPGAYALEPSLPLTAGTHQTSVGHTMFGAMADCAPDRWGRTLVTRRARRSASAEGRSDRSLGEIDFLLGVRDDLRQGALRFRLHDGPFLAADAEAPPRLTDLPGLLALASAAEQDKASLSDLDRLVRAGSSLGGARPKAHVIDNDGRVAIAKFPSASQDTWDVMAWEKVALDLASAAGVDVPPSRLLDLAGRQVLLVERFDRTADLGRVGYVSAMTMLEATDGEQRSYLEIADVVERSSPSPAAQLEQLWRRIVFSILISNTDDHLRNHGFLHAGGDRWRLSPAFDLNPTPTHGTSELRTAIDETDPTASLLLALDVAEYFRLDHIRARTVLDEVVTAVHGWRRVATEHGRGPREMQEMAPAFAALEHVPA